MTSLLARRGLRLLIPSLPVLLLSACNTVVMKPSGDIAAQQANLIVVSTVLMLLIIVPVIALIILFAWRYRKNNTAATYTPEWDHSTRLELVIWGAPLLIVIALGLVTWISTHVLDPYRPLQRLDAARPISMDTKPMIVEVVALDWKWLFIYPEQGIATVNELVAPIDVPIRFKITASTVMNSFFIPALAGQIYAMPGMQTTLNAVINKPGIYEGFSANYSGAGFTDMRFKFHGKDQAGFDAWVKSVKAGTVAGASASPAAGTLDRGVYLELEKPSEREAVRRYSSVAGDLYNAILNRCVVPGTPCMNETMTADAHANHHPGADTKATVPAGSAADDIRTTPSTSVRKSPHAPI